MVFRVGFNGAAAFQPRRYYRGRKFVRFLTGGTQNETGCTVTSFYIAAKKSSREISASLRMWLNVDLLTGR
jgi:hypothetical protein